MELYAQLQARQEDAIGALQQHYGALIRYIVHGILHDAQDTAECVSDVMLRVWERIDHYDPQKGSFPAWLTAVARNTALDALRRRGAPTEPLNGDWAASTTPEQALLAAERTRHLKAVIAALPGDERILFYRKYYYLQSTAQIAAELALSERAVEGRLYRLRKKLQQKLGGDTDGF